MKPQEQLPLRNWRRSQWIPDADSSATAETQPGCFVEPNILEPLTPTKPAGTTDKTSTGV